MKQHMNFEEANSGDSQSSNVGYEGRPYYNGYSSHSYDQKLFPDRSLKTDYRLSLAIVSFVLWSVFFLILFIGEGVANVSDSPGARVLQPLLIFGFLLLTVFLIGMNLLFNRRR